MKTKTSEMLTLRDRLSQLTYIEACKLLGPDGQKLIQQGSTYETEDFEQDVYLGDDLFRFNLRNAGWGQGADPIVTITLMAEVPQRLRFNCTHCSNMCEHIGAAVSLILEEKSALGLAVLPPDQIPMESLSEEELVAQALAERQERANEETFRLQSRNTKKPWTDYLLTSATSGKTYRLALRGEDRGESYCSCPDFRTNTLGTCKHIMYALDRVKKRFTAAERSRKFRQRDACVHLLYGEDLTLHLRLPDNAADEALKIAGPAAKKPVEDVSDLLSRVRRLEKAGVDVTIYPDAEEYINRRLFQDRIAQHMDEIRKAPAKHPLRTGLLKTPLLPYQLDGIAFAVKAGRAILADDMGLGKTIQGVGVAEMLAREADIRRVLVVCPTSLKSQWRNEIHRFTDRDIQLIVGRAADRAEQYGNECFFTICNYEQVLRDILSIERTRWDLIILDEGQRIKNWESKTARVVKGLKSPFALVLSGTPLENRIDDLFSVVQFIDDRRLTPAFRFFNRHRVVNEKGKVLGYKNLDELRERLRPILLRRTRESVLDELPPRTTEILRVPPTGEQLELHQTHMRIVSHIVRKRYITEMDLLRLQKALLMCRMSANSTYLVDKQQPSYSSKLEHLEELLDNLFAEADRKAVLFSEWTTMLDLIEPLLKRRNLDYVRLDGSVPQKKRQQLIHQFQHNESCRLFITTNAGSTGLNLQSANTVINVDLPWNPAVLEQRISRAHRMGQRNPVQVYLLVTEETLEEKLLTTLSAKKELALAVLDADSDVTEVDMVSGMEELRRRLEVLLGAKPEAPVDETSLERSKQEAEAAKERQARVAEAGGELLGAAFKFLGELVSQTPDSQPAPQGLVSQVREGLQQCVQVDETGKHRLTVAFPDAKAVENLAGVLARFLVAGKATD
ncbi:MAG: DEAD/DEAH box helicase [Planctomycetaceae bacterium]|nr:DEAD/DEAH box helicase [Planctomycetaceae bacterium]